MGIVDDTARGKDGTSQDLGPAGKFDKLFVSEILQLKQTGEDAKTPDCNQAYNHNHSARVFYFSALGHV
jgi:hypothetical protein